MANLSKVTARARTRGKQPKEFTYEAVGQLRPRNVQASDGNDMLLDKEGKQVTWKDEEGKLIEAVGVKEETYKEKVKQDDGTEKEVEKTRLIIPEGFRWVEVDDVIVDNDAGNGPVLPETVTPEDFQQILTTLFDGNHRKLLIGAIMHANQLALEAVRPKAPEKVDELAEIVALLKMEPKREAVWRRSVTTTANLTGMSAQEAAKLSKEYKAAGLK